MKRRFEKDYTRFFSFGNTNRKEFTPQLAAAAWRSRPLRAIRLTESALSPYTVHNLKTSFRYSKRIPFAFAWGASAA
jgi:hypothetical protein